MKTTLAERQRLLLARGGALFFDSLLVAYAIWAVSYIQAHLTGEPGFLSRWPGLLCAAPFAALLWQSTRTSMGQLAYRLRLVQGEEPAHPSRESFYYVVVGLQVALLLAPLLLGLAPWPTLAIVLALGGSMALIALQDRSGISLAERVTGLRVSTRATGSDASQAPWWKRARPWILLFLVALTFWIGILLVNFDLSVMTNDQAQDGFRNIWRNIFDPDWSITGRVIEKLVETIFMALMASIFAIPVAFVLSIFGARNLTHGTLLGRVVYTITRLLMNVTRSIESIIWAITFAVWVGVGPFAGMLALFVHSVAALGKLYSEAIEDIDPGPVEAIQTTGANWVQMVRYAVVPQIVTPFLAFTVYRWDINVRMATVLGLVGAGGIGEMLTDAVQVAAWSKAGTIMLFITLVVWLMDVASSRARARLQ